MSLYVVVVVHVPPVRVCFRGVCKISGCVQHFGCVQNVLGEALRRTTQNVALFPSPAAKFRSFFPLLGSYRGIVAADNGHAHTKYAFASLPRP